MGNTTLTQNGSPQVGHQPNSVDTLAASTNKATSQISQPDDTSGGYHNSIATFSDKEFHNGSSAPARNCSNGHEYEIFGYRVCLTWQLFQSFLSSLSSIAIVVGCVMPYVPQYFTIHKNRSSHGFSTYVCLTLLMANILRIAFWFGHEYEMPLFIQSWVMIIAQILLLELCVRVKRRTQSFKKSFYSFKTSYFWKWTDILSYIVFLSIFTALVATAMYFFKNHTLFVESVGFLALVTESMLGLPQVLKNFKNRSVEGMSLMMVLMWFFGDGFKTIYYIMRSAPYQFWFCGLMQITIDIVILFQVCLFRNNDHTIKYDQRAKEMLTI